MRKSSRLVEAARNLSHEQMGGGGGEEIVLAPSRKVKSNKSPCRPHSHKMHNTEFVSGLWIPFFQVAGDCAFDETAFKYVKRSLNNVHLH